MTRASQDLLRVPLARVKPDVALAVGVKFTMCRLLLLFVFTACNDRTIFTSPPFDVVEYRPAILCAPIRSPPWLPFRNEDSIKIGGYEEYEFNVRDVGIECRLEGDVTTVRVTTHVVTPFVIQGERIRISNSP